MGRSSTSLRRLAGLSALALPLWFAVPAQPQQPAVPPPSEELVSTVEGLSARRVPGMRRVVRVRAQGTVRTPGFSRAKLLPFPGRNPPADGMYEFAFTVIATAGQQLGQAESVLPVEVAFDWFGVPDNAVGIRVRAGANVIETRIEPATAAGFDPAALIGRRLVVDGIAPGPGDVDPADLPDPKQILRADAEAAGGRVAGRLTVIVDENGIITDAYFG